MSERGEDRPIGTPEPFSSRPEWRLWNIALPVLSGADVLAFIVSVVMVCGPLALAALGFR